jgi:hypothetical protein
VTASHGLEPSKGKTVLKILPAVAMLFFLGAITRVEAQGTEIPPAVAKRVIEKRAFEAITALKSRDLKHLSRLTHPDKGLIFSPYPGINDPEKALSKKEIRHLSLKDEKVFQIVPGEGSGDDKNYSFREYFDAFVYSKDFANAPEVKFNQFVHRGNCSITLFDKFPGSIIVEYHFPGFDPKRQGMDWQSLFLVFEKSDDSNWYLVDIAHDQWCI